MSAIICWLVFLSISQVINYAIPEKLSCWTLNVTADKTSYLYYYRGDPGTFVEQNLRGFQHWIPRIKFNSSAYVLGAVAADNKQPISLFVHDKISGGIYRFEDNLKSLQPVFKGSSVEVEDIAVDWLSNNIYYTDPLLGVGLVSYTKHFTIIIHKVAALHGIDVDPMSRMLFYADGDSGHIYQASLTGENHNVLSGSQTTNPTALVVDAVNKVLYWLDEGTQYLQSWNYARSEFKKIWNSYTVGVGLFTGIDLYEPYLFVSLKNEQRMKVIKTDGTEVLSFSPSTGVGSRAYGISISTPDRKPHVDSKCDDNNGGCEHICVHESNIARQCLCQFGYKPWGDSCVTEHVEDKFLLFADSSSNILYQVSTDAEQFHALHESSMFSASTVTFAYDPEEKTIYWTGKDMHRIWRMNFISMHPEIFTDLGSSSTINTLVVDIPRGNLYYTDTTLRRIGRINLQTKNAEVILQLKQEEKPTYLQLDADRRYMYWTDGGHNPKIEISTMDDNSFRYTLVSSDLQMPSGLALDLSDNYLYWADARLRRVERVTTDGSTRSLYTVMAREWHGLAMCGGFFYLSGERSVIRIEKEQRKIDHLGPEYFLITSAVSCYSSSTGTHTRRENTDSFSAHTTIIIAVVVGGVILLAIIIAVSVAYAKRRNSQSSRSTSGEGRRQAVPPKSRKQRRNKPSSQLPPPAPAARSGFSNALEPGHQYETMRQMNV